MKIADICKSRSSDRGQYQFQFKFIKGDFIDGHIQSCVLLDMVIMTRFIP